MKDPIAQLHRLRSQRTCCTEELLCDPFDVILREFEGYRFGYFLVILEGCARGVLHRGDTHVRVLLLEDLCNRFPGFSALVVREETVEKTPNMVLDK